MKKQMKFGLALAAGALILGTVKIVKDKISDNCEPDLDCDDENCDNCEYKCECNCDASDDEYDEDDYEDEDDTSENYTELDSWDGCDLDCHDKELNNDNSENVLSHDK